MDDIKEEKNEAAGQNREFVIIVNGREKAFSGKEIIFKQIVELAFGVYEESEGVVYTVSYSKGDDRKSGTMVKGGPAVKIKSGMIFNVTRTDKS